MGTGQSMHKKKSASIDILYVFVIKGTFLFAKKKTQQSNSSFL